MITGIIPARYESTRFPGKPLVDIHGKSMLQRVYEQCLKSNLDRVLVATDDERIVAHVQAFAVCFCHGCQPMVSQEIGSIRSEQE